MATAGQGQAQAAGAAVAARARARRNRLPGALVLHLLLLIFAFLWVFPFAWMLLSSFKGADETFHKQTFLPQVWYFANYPQALKDIPYLRYALNTAIIAGANVLGTLLSCTPPA